MNWRLAPAALLLFILPFTHTVALRLLALAIAFGVCCWAWWRDGFRLPPIALPFALWAAFALASLAWSIDRDYSRGEVKNEVLYAAMTLCVFYTLTRDAVDWQRWRRVLALQYAAMLMFALGSFLIYRQWREDPHGGVGNFSTYLVFALPLLLGAWIEGRRRWLIGIALLGLLISGLLTANAALWPSLVGAALVFYLLHRRRLRQQGVATRRQDVAALAGVLVLGIGAGGAASVKWGYGDADVQLIATQIAKDPRQQIWRYSLQRFAERPWLGHGAGRGILRKAMRVDLGSHLHWHAHNLLLSQAVQFGLLGSALFVALLLSCALALWRGLAHPDAAAASIAISALALLAGFLTKNMTDDFFNRDVALLFWAAMGASLGAIRRA